MSAADRAALQRGAELHRPLARAAKIGNANGLGYVVFGALSLMLAVVSLDLVGLAIGGVLVGIGISERRASVRLVRADPEAPRRLASGELALLGAIVAYAILGLAVLPSAGETLKQQLGAANVRDLGIDVERLADAVSNAWYGTVVLVSLLYQGGMARYFLRRRDDVARYRTEVPADVREVVETMAS